MKINPMYLIFGGLTLAIALAGLLIQLFTVDTRNWKTTEAIITHSELRTIKDPSSNDYRKKAVSIEYQYSVEKKTYTSNKIAIGWGNNTTNAQKIYNDYPQNSKVKVHYNPKKPQEAVLISSNLNPTGITVLAVGSFMFILVTLVFAITKTITI